MLDQDLPVDEFRWRSADLTLKLASALGVADGEAQYVLLASRLTGDRRIAFDDHFDIRMRCWRARGLWPSAGHAGTVVRLRFPHAGPRRLGFLTADFDNPDGSTVQVAGDNFFGICVRREIAIPRQPVPAFLPLRLRLAYGIWTESDGARVLFSRDYAPMWRLRDGEPPRSVSPFDWITYTRQEWFWEDRSSPWDDHRRIAEEEARLESYGVPDLSGVADLLPAIVTSVGNVPRPAALLAKHRRRMARAG